MTKAPFTILTGYLGAGKTTILNRMLAHPQRKRIAVLVNELGRISIDTQRIISRGGDVLELSGGCVCCKVDLRNDLIGGIADVVERSKPDHVVLETTGIAEPAALLEALRRRTDAPIKLSGVVCVVDPISVTSQIDDVPEVRAQIEAASALLLTKTDIATVDQVDKATLLLESVNPEAPRASFPDKDDGNELLTPWVLDTRATREIKSTTPHRHGQLTAVSFSDTGVFSVAGLRKVIERYGDRLVRMKGTVAVTAQEGLSIDKAGGRIFEKKVDGPIACSELVFIGQDIDSGQLHSELWACRVGSSNAAS